MRVPKAIKEGDESNLFLEFLYICNVFTKLDDLIRPKSIIQAQKRILLKALATNHLRNWRYKIRTKSS